MENMKKATGSEPSNQKDGPQEALSLQITGNWNMQPCLHSSVLEVDGEGLTLR